MGNERIGSLLSPQPKINEIFTGGILMATDYIIFIHGVKVRSQEGFEQQAKAMFQRISAGVNNPNRTLKPVVLFWGNVGQQPTETVLSALTTSPQWKNFWFQELRTTEILPFVGDAALYLSRFVSSAIVKQITDQAIHQIGLTLEQLKNPPNSDDRLHLVTHSWGTVVLFDILFATRWEDPDLPEETRQQIENVRRGFFGVGTATEKQYGIPLASIHTMGSPIALFNLVNINGPSSFNLSPKLKEFLEALQARTLKVLPWRNYAHPGDPIAYPLEGVIPLLLGQERSLVNIEDIMSPTSWLGGLFSQNILSIVNGGKAHGSYWTEPKVAQAIGKVIRTTQN
jgi:hypothetical protein